jgi:hypothetical protein
MGLSIDELLPEEEHNDKVSAQVAAVKKSHGRQFPPNYALSWMLANQVVQRYYRRLGLDALPIWRDNFGWSQFNLTQAANYCEQPPNRTLESQRYVMFEGIAVNWRNQGDEVDSMGSGGTGKEAQFDFFNAVWIRHERPNTAMQQAIDHLNLDETDPFDHSGCLHGQHSYVYTKLFQVVTDLICNAPELVAKREIAIDLDHFGNPYDQAVHPLRVTGQAQAGVTREWFELFHIPTNSRAYINISTGEIVYTDPDDTPHVIENQNWVGRNEEQLTAYFSQMLRIENSN